MPLTAGDEVPDELATLVCGVAVGKPVHPAASISTVRRRHRILDPDGLLAEVADDTVRATAAAASAGAGAVVSEWHEVEVELGEAGDGTLAPASRRTLDRTVPPTCPHDYNEILTGREGRMGFRRICTQAGGRK